jgi:general L-amino acid transport system substrate-binding protein
MMNVSQSLRCQPRNLSAAQPLQRLLLINSIALFAVLTSCAAASPPNQTANSPTASSPTASASPVPVEPTGILAQVLDRGQLICGVSGKAPGFSFVNAQGEYSGFNVDICRAVAVAVFNDPSQVEFRQLSAAQRFTSLQTGSIDIISQNATVTTSRESTLGVAFGPVVLYDGQGLMVKKSSGITEMEQLAGKSICVQTGSTTILNLADQFRKRGLDYNPIVFDDYNATFAAYYQGRCDAVTTDRSVLVSQRAAQPNPDDHTILEGVLSKEPLAPGVKQGDPQWANVLTWVVYALIQAEEFGITSENVEQIAQTTTDPDIRRFLGLEGDLGKGLGLNNDFALQVIKQIGNYRELYDRNLGNDSPLKLERGLNQLWTDGGLLYSPPFR